MICNIETSDVLVRQGLESHLPSRSNTLRTGDYYGDRYSTTFSDQPYRDVLIQGLLKKYSVVTGEFTRNATRRDFEVLDKNRFEKDEAEGLCDQIEFKGASVHAGKVVAEVDA